MMKKIVLLLVSVLVILSLFLGTAYTTLGSLSLGEFKEALNNTKMFVNGSNTQWLAFYQQSETNMIIISIVVDKYQKGKYIINHFLTNDMAGEKGRINDMLRSRTWHAVTWEVLANPIRSAVLMYGRSFTMYALFITPDMLIMPTQRVIDD